MSGSKELVALAPSYFNDWDISNGIQEQGLKK